jgi:hypothetical protein
VRPTPPSSATNDHIIAIFQFLSAFIGAASLTLVARSGRR